MGDDRQVECKHVALTAATRRDVLAGGGASILAVSSAAPVRAHTTSDRAPTDENGLLDVIVIGGGFCGVTAARELRRAGHSVVLLEARGRLGGRTFTAPFAGKDTEMGGTWVHWFQPYVWSEIGRYGLSIEETPGATSEQVVFLDYDGRLHTVKSSDIWSDLEGAVAEFFENAYEIMPRPSEPFAHGRWIDADQFSVQQKLPNIKTSPTMRPLVDALFTTYGSAAPNEIAWVDPMRYYALSGYTLTLMNDVTARYKIKGGTRALIDAIANDARADIRLNTPVTSVRDVGRHVEVVTVGGEQLRAKSVVCAVPLNVLQDIRFDPGLPAAKIQTSQQRHAGHGIKVHMLLKGEYPNALLLAPGGDAALNFVLWDGVIGGNTHLIGFGPSVDLLNVNDRAAVQTAIRRFMPQSEVIEVFGHPWTSDPYSKGVWGVGRPGQMSHRLRDLQESHGRIVFGNSDWASGWRGFIDGAIEQGVTASRKALTLLR